MVLTYEYNTDYNGPALPIVETIVRSLGENDVSVVLWAVVDSGADATMIPLRNLNHMAARKVDTRRVRGIGGLSYPVDIYEVVLQLGSFTIPKVYAVADRQNGAMILGRDVLNQFIVTLNGLAHVVEIQQ